MARVVVDVMLKPEILDPQGQAVQRALPRLGFDGILDVRQGKRFEIDLDGPADEAALTKAREIAEKLLANTVIEEFTVAFDAGTANTATAATATATTPLTAIHGAGSGSAESGGAASERGAIDNSQPDAVERSAD